MIVTLILAVLKIVFNGIVLMWASAKAKPSDTQQKSHSAYVMLHILWAEDM